MKPFTFGSLFSGIGGIDLGFERAGMSCLWQVEIDPFCRKILRKHWPNVPKYEDVKNVGSHNLETVDLIAGGFPCQPHSLAGKRKGAEDDRNLWPEYRRIIGELNPTWVVAENVPGIKTTILDDVLFDLESLYYQTRTLVIPACALGAPHIRERVFILAHSNSIRQPGQRTGQSASDTEWHDPTYQPGGETEFHASITGGKVVAYAAGQRCDPRRTEPARQQRQAGIDSGSIRNSTGERFQDWGNFQVGTSQERNTELQLERPNWWEVEPGVGRVANGISDRVDRLKGLGNAVVPQVAEWFATLILQVESRQ